MAEENDTQQPSPEAVDPASAGSDFTVALQQEYDHIMVSLGMACRKSGGDLTAPDVVTLLEKAEALDAVCKLWGVNPNNAISDSHANYEQA